MLTPEPSDSGMQVTLHAAGVFRFLPAAFLSVWLCGWAVGEWFALRLLATTLRRALGTDVLASWFPDVGGKLPPGPGLPVFAGFIVLWLALWTFGGMAALQQVFALLFGCERVRWGGDALEIERSALWFVSVTRLPALEITGFRPVRGSLVADRRKRATKVTSSGSSDDRQQLAGLLEAWRASFGPRTPLAADESPVPAYVAFHDKTGAIALRVPGTRHPVGAMLALAGAGFWAGAVAMFTQKTGVALVVDTVLFTLVGFACLAGSVWLLEARASWHMGAKRLERRRSFLGRTWSAEFVPLELELSSTRDSDGDLRWQLVASGKGRRQVIASAITDPSVPRALGTWVSERTGAPLVSRDVDDALRRAS
jgi:hypothetical protein